LVIGAHSLSELDWTTFLRLFRERGLQATCRVLRDAPLATQRGSVEKKLNLIAQRFKEDRRLLSENGQVANILFRSK
jgi:hypothetical protein